MSKTKKKKDLKPTRLRDDEIWNLDSSLAGVIADAVKRLKEMDHGWGHRHGWNLQYGDSKIEDHLPSVGKAAGDTGYVESDFG